MSRIPRMTLIGMYNFDSHLFDDMTMPEDVDKQKVINTLLLAHGERPVLYMDVDFMKTAIKIWAEKWQTSFTRMAEALTAEYNPIHNFDRNEEYDDTINTSSKTVIDTDTTDGTEETVSAMNTSTYQPDRKSESGGTLDSTTDVTGGQAVHHAAHLYGNIGLTRSQEMVLDELRLREENNIYDAIGNMFADELLLYEF